MPQCPVGPKSQQLETDECPLHVNHPPTGEEFALGCGICRNAHTFWSTGIPKHHCWWQLNNYLEVIVETKTTCNMIIDQNQTTLIYTSVPTPHRINCHNLIWKTHFQWKHKCQNKQIDKIILKFYYIFIILKMEMCIPSLVKWK